MNRDPFLRLALVAAVSLYAIALAAAWRWLGWPAGVAGLLAGVPGALALTLERTPPEPAEDQRARRRQPKEGTAGFERIS